MTVAATLLMMTTGQPASAGAQAASPDAGVDAFAALLEAITGKQDGTEAAIVPGAAPMTTASFPTQMPTLLAGVAPSGEAVAGEIPQSAIPAATPSPAAPDATIAANQTGQPVAATPEQTPALSAQPAIAPEAASVETPATAAVQSAATPAPAEAAAAAAPAQAPVIAQSVSSTRTAARTAGQSSTDASVEGTQDSSLTTIPQAGQPPAAAMATPVNQPSVMAALGLPATADAPAPVAAPMAATPAPTQSAEIADNVQTPAAQTPQPTSSPNTSATPQPAAQAQASAQLAPDVVAASAPDITQPAAATQAVVTDLTASATATTTEAARAPTPPALQSAPAATIQVYQRIIERADGRAQRFEVRLDPAELGRVDVRIEIGADRKVHAVLAAHDSAALSDLMRGQRALERALTDAGIDLADKGVRFELAADSGRNGASAQRDADGGRPQQPNVWRSFDLPTTPATAETATTPRPSWRTQRLDLVA